MLNEILDQFKKGRTFSFQELADSLNTDVQTVKAQIDYLERQGYIKKVEVYTSCAGGCSSCAGCNQGTQRSIIWELSQ
ncbi:FeoC-like transcriptional regulator [Anaerotignum sp.]|uniref:FeoC-like transcriptional regulator n=1 Tax=Anaerotignum sp. TaxID=2039241 RepID=UPI0027145859|nr:FeoC-like transcriptional regulator [Anaerotignum sp.]